MEKNYKDGKIHKTCLSRTEGGKNDLFAWVKWDKDFKMKDGSVGGFQIEKMYYEDGGFCYRHKGKHFVETDEKNYDWED